jgi:hypothetical protein
MNAAWDKAALERQDVKTNLSQNALQQAFGGGVTTSTQNVFHGVTGFQRP